MGCIYDEPLQPYICEAEWNCKDCPNWVEDRAESEEQMKNLCDLCLRDPHQCKNPITPCNYIPKYNLCPICKERVIVYEPRCYKCGYDFKAESEIEDGKCK